MPDINIVVVYNTELNKVTSFKINDTEADEFARGLRIEVEPYCDQPEVDGQGGQQRGRAEPDASEARNGRGGGRRSRHRGCHLGASRRYFG